MAFSVYVTQTWTDGSGSTPVSAARLGTIETGVFNAHYMPAVAVTHNAAQSITASTETTLAFNTERFDQAANTSDTMHDTVTNNSRLTARYAGVYEIKANVEFAAGSSNALRYLKLKLNATTDIARLDDIAANGVTDALAVSRLYSLAVNDFVEVRVFHANASAINVNSTGNYSPEFSMVRVG